MYAFAVDYYIRILSNRAKDNAMAAPGSGDGKDYPYPHIDAIYNLLNQFKPCGMDERHDIWISAPVGTINDYIAFYQEEEELTKEDIEFYTEDFKSVYGKDTRKFYLLSILQYKTIRSIWLGRELILSYDTKQHPSSFSFFSANIFFTWLEYAVGRSVNLIKDKSYQALVIDNLPYRQRTGIITYADWWKLHPNQKETYFKRIGYNTIEAFVRRMKAEGQGQTIQCKRIDDATASWYLHCCAIAYHATGIVDTLPGDKSLYSDADLYQKFADGRDEGLLNIERNNPRALSNWYEIRERGGHPWEILRGGNSTHISLYLQKYESPAGYVLILQGNSYTRSAETIQIYNALCDAGEPVILYHSSSLLGRIDGTALIGIVPENVTPVYCDSLFPNHTIVDAVNLERDEEEQVGKCATWFEETVPEKITWF